MWTTARGDKAELDAAQETDEAKAAARTAMPAVKSVEPTCPVRAALRTWETRTGLDAKRVSALLGRDAAALSRWRNQALVGD